LPKAWPLRECIRTRIFLLEVRAATGGRRPRLALGRVIENYCREPSHTYPGLFGEWSADYVIISC